jgi:hypothetical protein
MATLKSAMRPVHSCRLTITQKRWSEDDNMWESVNARRNNPPRSEAHQVPLAGWESNPHVRAVTMALFWVCRWVQYSICTPQILCDGILSNLCAVGSSRFKSALDAPFGWGGFGRRQKQRFNTCVDMTAMLNMNTREYFIVFVFAFCFAFLLL